MSDPTLQIDCRVGFTGGLSDTPARLLNHFTGGTVLSPCVSTVKSFPIFFPFSSKPPRNKIGKRRLQRAAGAFVGVAG
jgi:hypothetical protein